MASYTISPIWGAGAQLFDNSGNVLSGGKIYTYAAGTTTPATTYTTPNGSVANSNPIIANSAGRLTNEIWFPVSGAYKFVLKDANDISIASYDNIPTIAQPPIVNDASSISYEQGYQVTAGNFTIGATYLITSIGTTDFVAIGAASNDIGILFTATGVGSGTGTALYSRTVATKLQDYVSVKDFGATSGTDTVAINAAIAYAISSGKRVQFPFAATIRVPEDAPTLQDAIDAIYPDPTMGFILTVRISSGYEISEGLLVVDGDYSNIYITSVDSTVNIASTFVGVNGGDGFSVNSLFAVRDASAPRWSILVDCDDRAGGLVYVRSKGVISGSKGVLNSSEYGLYVNNQSSVVGVNGVFSGSGYGNRVTVNSFLSAPQANFSNTKNKNYVGLNVASNLDVSRGSVVYITGATGAETNLTGGKGGGLNVRRSFVSATNVDCSNVDGTGVGASLGAVVAFDGGIASNCGVSGIFCDAARISFGSNGVAIDNAVYNIQCQAGGTVMARNATLTGAGTNGVRAAHAGQIYIPGANCWRNGASDQDTDIVVSEGSYISAIGANGGTNVNPMFPTVNGLIIKEAANINIEPRGEGDVASTADFDFPELSTANATIRGFRDTNTSGQKRLILYRGDGSGTVDAQLGVDGEPSIIRYDLQVLGALSKGSGSFKIDHPLKPETHHLVHSFIEGPQADNIYRGVATLQAGKATVNLDDAARMTHGTFTALNCNVQCFTTNESGWASVRGKVEGNELTIESQDSECTDTVSWMVIGERCDQHIKDANWTDKNGKVITEPLKEIQNG